MFQFLIGTLKTVYTSGGKGKSCAFQFLIGTLKTVEHYAKVREANKFQFLIGTLKTHHDRPPPGPGTIVSIPHRYAKNLCSEIGRAEATSVSIPHRYAKNALDDWKLAQKYEFQFLIGTLKTLPVDGCLRMELCFNSS